MNGKVIGFPTANKKKGGVLCGGPKKAVRHLHPIKRRLVEMGGRSTGRTLEWLAGESGCSSATIRNFMAGRTDYMMPYNYQKMLNALGVGENYIYGVGTRN